MNDKDRMKLVIAETDKFIDSQLDTRGFPSLQPLPNDKFEPHDKHGLSNVVVSEKSKLRDLADNPPADVIARIAEETGDLTLAENILEAREESVAIAFVNSHPSYYRSDWNYERLRAHLDDKHQEFNLENLDAAFGYLTRTGQLEVQPGQARQLDESELLSVINKAKSNQIEEAVTEYLTFTFPDAGDTWDDENLFLSDTRTVAARNAACKFVWFHSHPQVQDSAEFRQFEKTFLKNKIVHTIADYEAAWSAYEQYDRQIRREDLFSQPAAPAWADLEELNDAEVETLTHKTRRARAKQIIAARKGSSIA
jgi:hypothetical protein